MNIKSFIIPILLLCFISCNTPKHLSKNKPIDDAKKFSLEVVKTYFDEDCDTYYEMISDEVFTIDGKAIIKKSGLRDRICKSLMDAIINKEKSFQNYLEDYKTEVITIAEMETRFKIKLPEYISPDKSDFLFIGYELKDENTENYLWDDMFVFFVRKENGKWVVKGGE